jgi:hypothetical protein
MAVTPANKIVRGGDLQTVGTEIKSALAGKQDTLVSGTTIKTVNNVSLLGSGNISISTEGVDTYVDVEAKTLVCANIASADQSGEENVIEGVTFNGTAAPITNKIAAITASIPTESTVSGWGFTKNTGTITGIKMNGAYKGTSGAVDLGTVITSETQSDWNVTNTSSAAYIKNKPTIPSAVTESTVTGWGFTKNTGTYSKPSGGIPKTDLASAVQTSLGKADTALQSYTETDPTVPAWAKAASKPTYTASEVGALPSTTSIPTKTSDLTNDSGFARITISTSEPTSSDGSNGDIWIVI